MHGWTNSHSDQAKDAVDTNESKSLSRTDSPLTTNSSKSLSRTDCPQMESTPTSDLEKVSTFC
jgi:hypothetical protein